MDITISTSAVLKGLLFLLAIGVGVLLMVVLLRMLKLQKKVDAIVTGNTENINKLMAALPITLESLNDGVQSVKQTVDSARASMVPVVGISVPVGTGFLAGAEGIINIAQSLGDAIKSSIQYFKK